MDEEQSLEKVFESVLHENINELIKSGKSEQDLDTTDFKNAYSELVEKIASDTVDVFKATMYEKISEEQILTDKFVAHQKGMWLKSFTAYESLYIIATETAEAYGSYLNELGEKEKVDKTFTFAVLRELHGRACQIYLEILCLIQNGFADGAFARWRSLYEISIVSYFIFENGEEVAKKFMSSSNSEDEWHDWAKNAECFQEKRYQKKNITFADLQKTTIYSENEVWKRQYKLANKIIHASPQGIFGRLSLKEPTEAISAGRSDFGIDIPAEHAAISLCQITNIFLSLFPYVEGNVAMKYISKWVVFIQECLTEDRKHFDNEEKPKIY